MTPLLHNSNLDHDVLDLESDAQDSDGPGLGPILDVIFILLMFLVVFIVTVVLNTDPSDGLKLPLPNPESSYRDRMDGNGGETPQVTICVRQAGEIFKDGKATSLSELKSYLKQSPDDLAVILKGEESAEWKTVTEILALVKETKKQSLFIRLQPARGPP